MMKQPDHVDVSFYVLIEPKWNPYWEDPQGRPILSGARLGKATSNPPSIGKAGGVVTKLTLRIDAAALLPLQPEAIVHVHPGNSEVIEVEAIDPDIAVEE